MTHIIEGVDCRRYVYRKTHGCGCITVFDKRYWKSVFEFACNAHDADVTEKDRL